MKKTLILGATPDSTRYANLAANRLVRYGHPIVNIGLKTGEAAGVPIEKPKDIYTDIDTITMYVGTRNQESYYDYILSTNPQRIIFNPGTENYQLEALAEEKGIECVQGCTLVMLSTGQF
ncbi:MAG TPA: CoA-binding protein [Sphingobacteriaceae bacterium]|nr:CoA-binding protein [Sphingobacteriaceae bacterium]